MRSVGVQAVYINRRECMYTLSGKSTSICQGSIICTQYNTFSRDGLKLWSFWSCSKTSIVFSLDLSSLSSCYSLSPAWRFNSFSYLERMFQDCDILLFQTFLIAPWKGLWRIPENFLNPVTIIHFSLPRTYLTVVLSWIIHHRELLIKANLKNICILKNTIYKNMPQFVLRLPPRPMYSFLPLHISDVTLKRIDFLLSSIVNTLKKFYWVIPVPVRRILGCHWLKGVWHEIFCFFSQSKC